MTSFVGVLLWSKHHGWRPSTTLAVAAAYSLAIVLMGVRRHRIHRRHRPDR